VSVSCLATWLGGWLLVPNWVISDNGVRYLDREWLIGAREAPGRKRIVRK
jgi:hypothetical protein